MVTTGLKSHGAQVTPTQLRTIPRGWGWLADMRNGGMIPRCRWVRVALNASVPGGDVLHIPPEADLASLDFSCLAALDVYLIFDGGQTRYQRLRDVCAAFLECRVESLRLLDANAGRFAATLLVGHREIGRYLNP